MRRTYVAPHADSVSSRAEGQHPAAGSSRHVNNMLHTLRGEQFRHSQNLAGVHRSRLSLRTHSGPTLPAAMAYPSGGEVAARVTPRSWLARMEQTGADEGRTSPRWRSQALRLTYERLSNPGSAIASLKADDLQTTTSRIPSLSQLCLLVLHAAYVSLPPDDFAEDVLPFLSSHLRRDLVRYTAVHMPMATTRLFKIYEEGGNSDGEIIVAGPNAHLKADWFKPMTQAPNNHDALDEPTKTSAASPGPTGRLSPASDWDSDDNCGSGPLLVPTQVVILISTRLPVATLGTLPPSLTILALIDLPQAVQVYRLTSVCPQLRTLDLSYNRWMTSAAPSGELVLDRVEWTKWRELEVLGIRECEVADSIIGKVNQGRWVDVEIVR